MHIEIPIYLGIEKYFSVSLLVTMTINAPEYMGDFIWENNASGEKLLCRKFLFYTNLFTISYIHISYADVVIVVIKLLKRFFENSWLFYHLKINFHIFND